MPWLRRRKNIYYVVYKLGRKNVARSTRTSSKLIAKKILRKVEDEIEKNPLNHQRLTCHELFTNYIEHCRYKSENNASFAQKQLTIFISFISKLKGLGHDIANNLNIPIYVDEISTQDIERYQNHLLSTKSIPTATRYMKPIRSAYNYAYRLDIIKDNPIKRISKIEGIRYKKPHFLTSDHISTIFNELSKGVLHTGPGKRETAHYRERKTPLYEMVAISYYAGLRLGEIIHLEWQDIDFALNKIDIRVKEGFAPKNKKEREIPLHNKLKEILLQYHNKTCRDKGYIFLNSNNNLYSRTNLGRYLRALSKRLGFRFNWYSFRHTCASHLVQQSVPILAVARILGHSSVTVTEKHYAGFSSENINAYINRLDHSGDKPRV